MPYNYEEQKHIFLNEAGLRNLVKARDAILKIMKETGAIRMAEADRLIHGFADTWENMAVLDWMVRHGDVVEVTPDHFPGQWRTFILRKDGM